MKRTGLIITVIVLSSLLITLLLYDFLYQLADQLLYLGWRVSLAIRAFDQRLIWALFSIPVFVILLSRIARTVITALPARSDKIVEYPSGNLGKWDSLFSRVLRKKRDDYARWHLAEEIFGLTSKIISARKGLNQQQFKKLLENGQTEIPQHFGKFLQAGYTPFSKIERRSTFTNSQTRLPLDIDPDEVVRQIEKLYGYDS